jgi:hypothetical protein
MACYYGRLRSQGLGQINDASTNAGIGDPIECSVEGDAFRSAKEPRDDNVLPFLSAWHGRSLAMLPAHGR